jgi:hypothetical protein
VLCWWSHYEELTPREITAILARFPSGDKRPHGPHRTVRALRRARPPGGQGTEWTSHTWRCSRVQSPVGSTPVPAERSYIGRREWTVALVAVVLLGTGACGSSDEPAASASGPSPQSTRTHRPQAVRLRHLEHGPPQLPRRRPTDRHHPHQPRRHPGRNPRPGRRGRQRPRYARDRRTHCGRERQPQRGYWLQLLAAVQITRGSVQFAGDDPQKIHAAMHKQLIEKYEQHLLDLCRGHYSSPEAGA